ncbi:hypothetical protein JCM10369A_42290 [Nocardioides pyridinolyticus]
MMASPSASRIVQRGGPPTIRSISSALVSPLASKEELLQGSWVLQLIDELRINTAYAISSGILAVVFLSAAGAYDSASSLVTIPLSSVGTGLVVHLLMTLGMILKRTNTACVEMRKRTKRSYS